MKKQVAGDCPRCGAGWKGTVCLRCSEPLIPRTSSPSGTVDTGADSKAVLSPSDEVVPNSELGFATVDVGADSKAVESPSRTVRLDSREFSLLEASEQYRLVCRRLEDLTPGGSEFHQSPERCIRHAEDRIASLQEQVKRLIKQRNAGTQPLTDTTHSNEEVFMGNCQRCGGLLDDAALCPNCEP